MSASALVVGQLVEPPHDSAEIPRTYALGRTCAVCGCVLSRYNAGLTCALHEALAVAQRPCDECGWPLPPDAAGQRRFCDDTCRERSSYRRRKQRAGSGLSIV